MSKPAAIAILVVLCIGMMSLVALVTVAVIDHIQEMKHRNEEWKREKDAREWGHR